MINRKAAVLRAAWILLIGSTFTACGESGKWLDAADAQNNYGLDLTARALQSGKAPPDTSCEMIIEDVRNSIQKPEGSVTGMKVIVAPCNTAGLEFGGEARCHEGRLQVLCK